MTRLKKPGHLYLMLGFVFLLPLIPTLTEAKDYDRNRTYFYGWVESKPEGLQGTWIIGGREITTTAQTEFDQEDGTLMVGSCAKA